MISGLTSFFLIQKAIKTVYSYLFVRFLLKTALKQTIWDDLVKKLAFDMRKLEKMCIFLMKINSLQLKHLKSSFYEKYKFLQKFHASQASFWSKKL